MIKHSDSGEKYEHNDAIRNKNILMKTDSKFVIKCIKSAFSL